MGWESLALGGLEAAALYAGLTFVQLALRRVRLLQRIKVALNLTLLCLSVRLFMGAPLEVVNPVLKSGAGAGMVFFALWALLGVLDEIVFGVVIPRRTQRAVPVVLRDIGRGLAIVGAAVLVIHVFFPSVNLNVLAMSSLVVGYIVGNATQDTLGNLIAGLALNTERPFEIGDWVCVGGHTGRVADMTWRATRLWTKANDYILIPNATIAREAILNYSRPTSTHALTLAVGAAYDAPPNLVRATLQGVLRAVPEVLAEPPPSVFLSGYGDSAVQYTVKFYIADFRDLDPIASRVQDLVWYHFRRAGISLPFPIRDVRLRTLSPADEAHAAAERRAENARILTATELFATLSAPEVDDLAAHAEEQIFAAGEVLVRQGTEGDSFYLIKRGQVRVSVTDAAGQQRDVAHLATGQFFGEMSLLTGERRTATVTAAEDSTVLVVAKQNLASLLESDALLAEKLAAVLARRNQARQTTLDVATGGGALKPVDASAVGQVLQRIRRFFGTFAT